MPAAADNHMVVHCYPKRLAGADDVLGHRDVGLGWGRVARRMVVHQDQGRGAQFERTFDHLAGIDRGVVDGTALLLLVGDQRVLAVEEQQMELPELCRCTTQQILRVARDFRLLYLRAHAGIVECASVIAEGWLSALPIGFALWSVSNS